MTLVFLHGLLGTGADWQEMADNLLDYDCVFIDLPGHGQSQSEEVKSAYHTCQLISESIHMNTVLNAPIVMVGYSLGARLAMYGCANQLFKSLNIKAYLLEGGHFGLKNENERKHRQQVDIHWAERYRREPMEQVLNDWYQQPVFASLSDEQRDRLIKKRLNNQGSKVASMLMATTLAKQPYLLEEVLNSSIYTHYVCGEKDQKFFELAKQSKLPITSIKNAGHNVHHEQPVKFAQWVRTQIDKQMK